MSSQSILTKTIDFIQDTSEKILLDNANNYLLKKRFALGKGICKEDTKHSLKILSFICTHNCELIEYINTKLNEDEVYETCFSDIKCKIDSKVDLSNYTCFFEKELK